LAKFGTILITVNYKKLLIFDENGFMKINEQTELYGNYGIWHRPFWQTTTFYMMIGAITFICFVLLCRLFIKKCRARRKKQVLPTWQRALEGLKLLQKNNKITPIHGKEFYLTVTAILKNYLQERFNLNLRGKTDAEVIAYLEKRANIDQKLLQIIHAVFNGSVMIKFANERAIQEQIELDFKRSVMIVKETMQQEKKSKIL